jgi:hypothetical protein
MLAEPTRRVKASSLTFQPVTMGPLVKVLPSFTDEELWEHVVERGVYSPCPRNFKHAFDVLVHREGILIYRMKPQDEWFIHIEDDEHPDQSGLCIHDPMEAFAVREGVRYPDGLFYMSTHDPADGTPYDVLETDSAVPYDQFSKYLDPTVSMAGFTDAVDTFHRLERFAETRPFKRQCTP